VILSLGSRTICYEQVSYASEQAKQGTGYIKQAKEQHIELSEAHIGALETEVQELAKRPVLDQGSGLQDWREELANEKHAVQEAQRGTSRHLNHGKTNTFTHVLFLPFAMEEKEKATQNDGEKIEELEQTHFEIRGEIGAGRHVPPVVRVLSLSANPAQG